MIELVILATGVFATEVLTRKNGNGKALQDMLNTASNVCKEQKVVLSQTEQLQIRLDGISDKDSTLDG